jgi:hypothetical protein
MVLNRALRIFCVLLTASAMWTAARPVVASQPAMWHWADDNDFRRGDLEGLALHPTLGLSVAPKLQRTEVEAEFVHCWLRDGQKVWLGTGLQGKVFLYESGKVREFAKVDAPMVASLALDGQGGLLAGLVGSGEIVRIGADGKVQPFVKLESSHVWAMVRRGNQLFAATGPGGKVYAVDMATKTAKLYAETGADHVLVLQDGGDALYAGTSDGALLLRIDREKSVRAIASFPGIEVRSMVRAGNAWYVAVNGGQTAAPLANLKATADRPANATAAKTAGSNKGGKEAQAKGKGAVWKRSDEGTVSRVFISPEGMVSEIGLLPGTKLPVIVAGAARGGRVVLGDDFGDVQSLFDVKEEEILGIEGGPKGPQLLFTGKSAAVYAVGQGESAPVFTSEVLAETGLAQWGRAETVGEGSLQVETRSGFTDPPSDTWSPWVALKDGQIQSPAANFLQVRVRLGGDQARLTELRVFRQVVNRAPLVTKIDAVPNKQKGTVGVSWAADDPDGDALAFLVQYRARGSKQWLKLHDRLYEKKTMELVPTDMPDGWYEVRVEVTDQSVNGAKAALATARISKPFLVDRGKPEISASLAGRLLTGKVVDGWSRIVRIEVSVDGEPTLMVPAKDGVMDASSEPFELELPAEVQKGPHTLLVTALDDAGNIGVTRLLVGQ